MRDCRGPYWRGRSRAMVRAGARAGRGRAPTDEPAVGKR